MLRSQCFVVRSRYSGWRGSPVFRCFPPGPALDTWARFQARYPRMLARQELPATKPATRCHVLENHVDIPPSNELLSCLSVTEILPPDGLSAFRLSMSRKKKP